MNILLNYIQIIKQTEQCVLKWECIIKSETTHTPEEEINSFCASNTPQLNVWVTSRLNTDTNTETPSNYVNYPTAAHTFVPTFVWCTKFNDKSENEMIFIAMHWAKSNAYIFKPNQPICQTEKYRISRYIIYIISNGLLLNLYYTFVTIMLRCMYKND